MTVVGVGRRTFVCAAECPEAIPTNGKTRGHVGHLGSNVKSYREKGPRDFKFPIQAARRQCDEAGVLRCRILMSWAVLWASVTHL